MERPIAYVIEDQQNLLMLYEDALRLVGYDVLTLKDGYSAINTLETTTEVPAFIILDINLPGLSGRDIHEYIRTQSRYAKVPVLILTANSLMAHSLVPTMTELDHVHIKPIGMKQLQDLARTMRPNADGVPEYLADTQKVPHLEGIEYTDRREAREVTEALILTPEDDLLDTAAAPVIAETATEPMQSILTPEDIILDDDTGTKKGGVS